MINTFPSAIVAQPLGQHGMACTPVHTLSDGHTIAYFVVSVVPQACSSPATQSLSNRMLTSARFVEHRSGLSNYLVDVHEVSRAQEFHCCGVLKGRADIYLWHDL